MPHPITLFSGYSQKENRTTNYCLLILKMLYEENPKFLAEALGKFVGEELSGRIGVKFSQQEKKAASVPDGLIVQPAFTIFIETKNFDWFYDAQLEKHLAALSEEMGFKVLIALSSSFEGGERDRFQRIEALCSETHKDSIAFKRVSFEEFLEALDLRHLPKNLDDAIKDFGEYLAEEGLLPSWEKWLDVVNCAGIPDDILVRRVYMCPATGGAYNHKRCKYFGMYQGKTVRKVAIIEAVVDLQADDNAIVKWKNIQRADAELKAMAHEKLNECRPGQYPKRVFLLGTLYDTDFRKTSSGGMQTSKRYFDVSSCEASNAEELALSLKGKIWIGNTPFEPIEAGPPPETEVV
jgi:hypothetical protein